MENRPPGPEDTENNDAKAAKAEGVAAWLSRQRDQEQHAILSELLKKKDEEEDDDEEEDEKGEKKPRRLKFGAVSIIAGDDKDALPKNTEEPEQPSIEHAAEEPADQVEADFDQWEQELAAAKAEQEDFDQWETEMAAPDEDVTEGQEDRQEGPEEPQHGPINNARRSHTPRTTASVRPSQSTASGNVYGISLAPPSTNAGGGGGANRPPIPGGPHSPNSPYGHGGGMNAIPFSPNVIPPLPTPDALTVPSPNKLKEHSHEHNHPRLAAATLVGLLIERGFRRRADKEIKREMKDQNEKFQKQNKRNQFIQDQVRQSFEARQTQLETEQRRQQRTIEHTRTASTEQVAKQAEIEMRQSPEQSSGLSANERPEARIRQRAAVEQVVTTAENDSPVERVYERRQEIKDEPSNPAGAASGGAASVGSLLSSNPAAQRAAGRSADDGSAYRQPQTGQTRVHDVDYKAAAIRGVGAALAVIMLALLAYALL